MSLRCATLCASVMLLASAAHALSVVDDTGQTVDLARPAQRIVSLAPHTTELLFGAGAGAQVVAVIAYSDFPDAAKKLPRVGGSRGLDLERIAALKPDLVIAWQSGNGAAQVARIEKLNIPVFRSEPKTLPDIAHTLRRFGTLTGHEEQAAKAAEAFLMRIEVLRRTYAQRAPVGVFYQVWPQPLMTIGGAHVISDVISLCGGRNVFAALPLPGPTVNIEAVVAAAPQLIAGSAADGGDATQLAMWQRWPSIPAVANRRFAVLNADLIARHSERLADGAAALCQAIDAARQAPLR